MVTRNVACRICRQGREIASPCGRRVVSAVGHPIVQEKGPETRRAQTPRALVCHRRQGRAGNPSLEISLRVDVRATVRPRPRALERRLLGDTQSRRRGIEVCFLSFP